MNFVKARNFVHLVMTGNGAKCKCSDMHLTKCVISRLQKVSDIQKGLVEVEHGLSEGHFILG